MGGDQRTRLDDLTSRDNFKEDLDLLEEEDFLLPEKENLILPEEETLLLPSDKDILLFSFLGCLEENNKIFLSPRPPPPMN